MNEIKRYALTETENGIAIIVNVAGLWVLASDHDAEVGRIISDMDAHRQKQVGELLAEVAQVTLERDDLKAFNAGQQLACAHLRAERDAPLKDGNCGHRRVYYAKGMPEGEYRERQETCLFCVVAQLCEALIACRDSLAGIYGEGGSDPDDHREIQMANAALAAGERK